MTNFHTTICWQGNHIRIHKRGSWEYAERIGITGIVSIIPITDNGKLVLVEQYRPPVDRRVIELPAGLAGDHPEHKNESLQTAAQRELLEETGYQARHWRFLFKGLTSAGLTTESITFFLATGLVQTGKGGGDETEDITTHEVPIDQLIQWLTHKQAEGLAIDLKIYAAIPFALENIRN